MLVLSSRLSCCSMLRYPSFDALLSTTKQRIRVRSNACAFHAPGVLNCAHGFPQYVWTRTQHSSNRRNVLKNAFLTMFGAVTSPLWRTKANPLRAARGLVCVRGCVKCRRPVCFLSREQCDERNDSLRILNPDYLGRRVYSVQERFSTGSAQIQSVYNVCVIPHCPSAFCIIFFCPRIFGQ